MTAFARANVPATVAATKLENRSVVHGGVRIGGGYWRLKTNSAERLSPDDEWCERRCFVGCSHVPLIVMGSSCFGFSCFCFSCRSSVARLLLPGLLLPGLQLLDFSCQS
jgi:hypothetical protein